MHKSLVIIELNRRPIGYASHLNSQNGQPERKKERKENVFVFCCYLCIQNDKAKGTKLSFHNDYYVYF